MRTGTDDGEVACKSSAAGRPVTPRPSSKINPMVSISPADSAINLAAPDDDDARCGHCGRLLLDCDAATGACGNRRACAAFVRHRGKRVGLVRAAA